VSTVKRKLRNVLRTDTDAQWHKHNLTNGLDTGKGTYAGTPVPVHRTLNPTIPSHPIPSYRNSTRTRARAADVFESAAAATGYPHRRRRGARESMKQIGRSAYTARTASPSHRPPAGGLTLARPRAAARRHKHLPTKNSKPFVGSRSTKRYYYDINDVLFMFISYYYSSSQQVMRSRDHTVYSASVRKPKTT